MILQLALGLALTFQDVPAHVLTPEQLDALCQRGNTDACLLGSIESLSRQVALLEQRVSNLEGQQQGTLIIGRDVRIESLYDQGFPVFLEPKGIDWEFVRKTNSDIDECAAYWALHGWGAWYDPETAQLFNRSVIRYSLDSSWPSAEEQLAEWDKCRHLAYSSIQSRK